MPKNRAPETLAVSAAKSNGQQALFRGKKRFFEALRLTRRALESIVSKTYSLADADFSWEISMKKILVAIDNSRYANNVLDFLTSVVAEASEKPEVTLFTVIEPSLPNEVLMRLGAAGTERFKSFAQSILTPAAETLQKAGIDPITAWAVGTPAEKIAEKAAQIEATYVLMGSRGLTALETLFFGSVTIGVLARTTTPVLIVRAPCSIKKTLTKIGIAVDESERSERLIEYLTANRKLFPENCQFRAIYVSRSADDFMFGALGAASLAASGRTAGLAQAALLSEAGGKELESQAFENVMEPLRESFAKLGNVQEVMLQGNAGDEIAKYALQERLDLLVMGSHGRSNVESAFAGSVVMRVAAQGSVPLFIVR